MTYIKRNPSGKLVAVSSGPMDGFVEATMEDQDDLVDYGVELLGREDHDLLKTDLDFVRVLEDVIELLMAKNVIQFTELPDASQAKMLARKKLRDGLSNKLDLLENDRSYFGDDSLTGD
jgi:hypothetical protein